MYRKRLFWLLVVLGFALGGFLIANRPRPDLPELDRFIATYSAIDADLYIGGRVPAPPPGTRAVLSLSFAKDGYTADQYQWSPIPDADPAPSLAWLRQQVEFVDAQRQAGRQVFVHCDAGVSRSGMVMAAYLMQHHRWRRDEALAFIRVHRPIVQPNPAFMVLLLQWEESLGLSPPASQPLTRPANS